MKGFRQRLKERQEKVNSLVCVGLDPLIEKIPKNVDVLTWLKDIVFATATVCLHVQAKQCSF